MASGRDWTEARAKVTGEGRCRVCLSRGRLEAAHVIARKWDPVGDGGVRVVRAVDVVPLCARCHDAYDRGVDRLDLLPYLSLSEQAAAVARVGIVSALRRTTGRRDAPDGLSAAEQPSVRSEQRSPGA